MGLTVGVAAEEQKYQRGELKQQTVLRQIETQVSDHANAMTCPIESRIKRFLICWILGRLSGHDKFYCPDPTRDSIQEL